MSSRKICQATDRLTDERGRLVTKAEGRTGTFADPADGGALPKGTHFKVTKPNTLSASRIWVSVMCHRMGEPAMVCDHDLAPLSTLLFTVLSYLVVCVDTWKVQCVRPGSSHVCAGGCLMGLGDTLTHRRGSHRNGWT